MNKLDKQYTDLLQDILDNGVTKQDRTGTGTLSVFGRQIRHKMSDGFPLLTTKKMPFRVIATELMWFLRGDTNIKFLVDNDCHIWDGDAYKNYLKHNDEVSNYWIKKNPEIESRWKPYSQEEFINKCKTDPKFAKQWGELGPVYGKQWRKWNKVRFRDIQRINQHPTQIMGVENPFTEFGKWVRGYEDQISNLIRDLKTNPDSRRLMVSAWNVGELDSMVLPPCHYGFQVHTRELNDGERMNIAEKRGYKGLLYSNVKNYKSSKKIFEVIIQTCDELNIPTRAISLMWNQRSVDTFLGLPFNIASYGLLLEIIAKSVNMVPDELIGNLGDTHLYLNHIEQAKEQIGRELSLEERHQLALPIWKEKYGPLADMMVMTNVDNTPYKIPTRTREPYPLPTLKHMKTDEFYKALSEDASLFAHLDSTDFQVENYQAHPHIKAPLSN
jgi:thymidylate synthase